MYLVVRALELKRFYCFSFRVNSTEFGERHQGQTQGQPHSGKEGLPGLPENINRHPEPRLMLLQDLNG